MLHRFTFILLLSFLTLPLLTSAQNWPTYGGGSSRSGLNRITGPQAVQVLWNATSSNPTTLGNAVYTFGDRFITSRVVFSPYTGKIECRNLQTGVLLWTSPFISSTSILYAIGHTEENVFAHDYATDTIFALDPSNGNIRWRSKIKSSTFGAFPGCVFGCNGDPIVNGPVGSGRFTMRLDKNTGDTVWTNSELIAIGPAVGLAANEERVYRITGGITLPIVLTAIDIQTGATLVQSTPIPGDPDQENPITLGPGNRIYFWRDGGSFHAYEDQGAALVPVWTYTPQVTTGAAFTGDISIGPDSSVYILDDGKVKRLSHAGQVLNASTITLSQGSMSIGADGTVYVNNKSGTYYALSADLQTILWQQSTGQNTYNNMALAKDGILVLTGAGTSISALQTPANIKPVADFRVSSRRVIAGQPIDFNDQSSFGPTTWQWSFPGASQGASTQQNPAGIVYPVAGDYPVQLISSNGFGSDTILLDCYIEVIGTVGLTEELHSGWKVYPNPASGQAKLQLPDDAQPGQPILLFDPTGRHVRSYTTSGPETVLDLTGLMPGMYILRFGDQGQHYQQTVLKN